MEDDDYEFNWKFQPPYHKFVLAVIKSVGWYLVGIIVVLIYTWPYLQKTWNSLKKKKDDMEYDAKYHKDVDFNSERLLATQAAREKMQKKFLEDRRIALLKEEEKKERKRQALLNKEGESSGYRLGDNTENTKSKLKGDYNPLMGTGTGGRYVPPKRSCCKKGGCG